MWPSNSGRQVEDEDDEIAARLAPVGADGPPPDDAMPMLVVIDGASVDEFLAELGLADPIGPGGQSVPSVQSAPSGAPLQEPAEHIESDAPVHEDPDAAAARWLAEELAALGIEL
jgi:hypothetical protein